MHPLRERILENSVRMPSGCREWQLGCSEAGYGQMWVAGKLLYVHRVSFVTVRGAIPEGLVLDHLVCDNPVCCDEWHVEPTTRAWNVMRGNGICAQKARQTHCIRNHPLSGENLYITPSTGSRQCRQCRRDHQAAKRVRTIQ